MDDKIQPGHKIVGCASEKTEAICYYLHNFYTIHHEFK